MQPTTIGPRVKLEILSMEHLQDYHAIWSEPEVAKWTSRFVPTKTMDESRGMLEKLITATSDNVSNYAILLEPDIGLPLKPRMIGVVGVHRAKPIELGYVFHPDAWGRGYATEAVATFLNMYWSEKKHVHAVRALVDPLNAASIAVLKKVGFVELGTGSFRMPSGEISDVSVFEIKRSKTASPVQTHKRSSDAQAQAIGRKFNQGFIP